MSSALLDDSVAVPSLVDQLLAEQRLLPAVDLFARRHLDDGSASTRDLYEQRIPLDRPIEAGQQLAFQVDLDACTGCQACVTACHSMNGLASEETWRDVGLVVGQGEFGGVQQTVTTACHHCEAPACLAGCPVQAYEKDPVTGIVRHLDDQCIGCQYCVLKCPYDVPKYSEELKIVRKCDMCTGRLAVGEAPACVQGCPTGAITIRIVDPVRPDEAPEMISGLSASIPDSSYTRPTTRYVSARQTTGLRPANLDRVVPAHSHDPLAIMLVFLQMSVGVVLVGSLGSWLGFVSEFARSLSLSFAAVTAVGGLAAATLHLGRPLYAFRAFLGWRTSWMSREIIVVGVYVPAIILTAVSSLVGSDGVVLGLSALATGVGILGTVCSMMIYVDTRRRAWALSRTAPLFSGTLFGLGCLGVAIMVSCDVRLTGQGFGTRAVPFLLAGTSILMAKVGVEFWQFSESRENPDIALARGIRLMRGPLRTRVSFRFGSAIAGCLAASGTWVLLDVNSMEIASAAMVGTFLCFAFGELIERHLYFTSEASPGMPGR